MQGKKKMTVRILAGAAALLLSVSAPAVCLASASAAEPAADLSIALAIVSSLKDYAVSEDVLAFGEIGLGGEIRAVNSCEQRIREAAKLGFRKCVVPKYNLTKIQKNLKENIEVIGVSNVRQAFQAIME